MKKVGVYNTKTNLIESVIEIDEDSSSLPDGYSSDCEVLESSLLIVGASVVDGVVIPPVDEEKEQLQKIASMKLSRNRLLYESDKVMLSDYPLLDKSEWVIYRQELRDITTQAGFPEDINWPVKPE